MSILVDQNILGFEVPVQDLLAVQILDGQEHLRKQNFSLSDGEPAVFRGIVEQLPARTQVQNQAKVVFRLKCIVQLDDKWVAQLSQDISLRLHLFCRLRRQWFLDALHRIQFASWVVPDHVHRSETALSKHFKELEVLN